MTEKTNCNYYTHEFKKKGELTQTYYIDNNGKKYDYKWIQEMECSKCKITTYYPSEAFNQYGELI